MSNSHTEERQGALLAVSLLLRKIAKSYEPKTMKAALLSTNADEAKELERLGLMDAVAEAGAGLCAGSLEGVAEIIEHMSRADDAAWLNVVEGVRDNLKAEPEAYPEGGR